MLQSSTPPRSLPDLTAEELAAWMENHGYKGFHALRVLRELYGVKGEKARARVRMPAGLAELVQATFPAEAASLALRQVAEDGTSKLLLR